MRNLVLTILWSTAMSCTLFAQGIPNPGFEQWDEAVLFEDPEGYFTTNSQAYIFSGAPHITRVQGRQRGTSAIRMEVDESVFFGISPIVFNLNLTNPLAGGVPFTGRPDSLVGHFNYQLSAEDTFSLIAIFKFQGIPLGFVQFDLAGSSSGFERLSIPLAPFALPPDTVAIAMGIGIVGGTPALGDFVEVDDLTFINSNDQLPNNEFENWRNISFQEPSGWYTINLFAAINGTKPSVSRTSDAVEGAYAARVESVAFDLFGFRDTAGVILTGNFVNEEEGFPYNGDFTRLDFQYKYEPVGVPGEMAFVNVVMQRNGVEIGSFLQELAPSSNYTQGSISFDLMNEVPDTCIIGFAVGVTDTAESTYVLGSVLYVDDLSFSYSVNTRDLTPVQISDLAYPNPANDIIWVREELLTGSIQQLDLISIEGSMVRSFQNGQRGIFVGDLAPGWYVLRVVTDESMYISKIEKH